jgi:hypothetical protein
MEFRNPFPSTLKFPLLLTADRLFFLVCSTWVSQKCQRNGAIRFSACGLFFVTTIIGQPRLEASLSEFGPNETGIRARDTAPQGAAWRSVLLMYSSPGLVRIIMEHSVRFDGEYELRSKKVIPVLGFLEQR